MYYRLKLCALNLITQIFIFWNKTLKVQSGTRFNRFCSIFCVTMTQILYTFFDTHKYFEVFFIC